VRDIELTSKGWIRRDPADRGRWFTFGSIRMRLMVTTTLVIVAIVGAVVWLWARDVRRIYRERTIAELHTFAEALAGSFQNELVDENWNQIRVLVDQLLADHDDFLYVNVTDRRLGDRIVASTPIKYQEQYVPTMVPLAVSTAAMVETKEPRMLETYLLEDVEFPPGHVRGHKGERIMEAAADVPYLDEQRAGVFRVGISMEPVERAVAAAAKKAILVGALGLIVGLAGAWIVAQRMARPVIRLGVSAEKIAAGDLRHRAEVNGADEIAKLATSFNEMAVELQASFTTLKKTLESFERFVPRKFLSVIAPEGIENIQVGMSTPRRLSILFSDIRGYTTLSETMTPLETFQFLNEYLARMGETVSKAGGFIDKYIGDAIMALFDDAATDGVLRAALAMRATLRDFNKDRAARGQPPINTGIGIHGGEVIMGTIGFTSRIDSTVVGDAVNLASRIEGLTKTLGSILVTESVIAGLAKPDDFKLRLVDEKVLVKGKNEPIAVYELQEVDS
jgi:class 3 adenylate cyclase/HAMP domain-containing protein